MAGRGRGQMLREALAEQRSQSRSSNEAVARPSTASSSEKASISSLDLNRMTLGAPSEKVVREGALCIPTIEEGPNFGGTEGRPLAIVANYVKLEKVSNGAGIFEYSVAFQPDIDDLSQQRICLGQCQRLGNHKTFDGRKLILPFRLEPLRFIAKDQNGQDVQVVVNFVAERPYAHSSSVTLLNEVFNRVMRKLQLVKMGRNLYNPKAASLIPQLKLEVWPGYVTAVDEYKDGLKVICDISHRVLRGDTVHSLMRQLLNFHKSNFKSEAMKSIVNSIVLTRYNNRSYRIDHIDFEKTPMNTFVMASGKTVTFWDYYKSNYGLEIKDKKQPLLISRDKRTKSILCLVPELCYLTGLSDAMRNDFKVMREIATVTRLSPEQRQSSFMNFIKSVKGTPEAREILHGWGLALGDEASRLSGRVLDPQMLIFGHNQKELCSEGDWNRATLRRPLLTPVEIKEWLVVFPAETSSVVGKFLQALEACTRQIGMRVMKPLIKKLENDRVETYLQSIKASVGPNCSLVLAIFPQQRSDRYAAVKKLCCVDSPVASQVVLAKTLANERRLQGVVHKIAMQINCKLGGELWGITTPHQGMMVVGIDVYHDPARKTASVAGMVATLNDTFSLHHSRALVQGTNMELVDSLRTAFAECLQEYQRINNHWPKSVIFFRDGIGDAQLEASSAHEVDRLYETFFKVTQGNKRFGFVVVQKRIHTRLMTLANGKWENPPPGTVVDQSITKKKVRDFYLVSQKVSQGTVSPTHYVVIGGHAAPGADTVQKLAYQLTHMYFNWAGTVRVPSVCLYAHKLATFVGEHIRREANSRLWNRLHYI